MKFLPWVFRWINVCLLIYNCYEYEWIICENVKEMMFRNLIFIVCCLVWDVSSTICSASLMLWLDSYMLFRCFNFYRVVLDLLLCGPFLVLMLLSGTWIEQLVEHLALTYRFLYFIFSFFPQIDRIIASSKKGLASVRVPGKFSYVPSFVLWRQDLRSEDTITF